MASITFIDTVTQIPAAWANDVNTLVYGIFNGSQNLVDAQTVLGLGTMAYQNENNIFVTGGTLNNVTIGNSVPGAGTFATLTVSATPLFPTNAANKAYVDTAIADLNLGNLAVQNNTNAVITGGSISGVDILASTGTFLSLSLINAPVNFSDVTNKSYVDDSIASLGVLRDLSHMSSTNVTITGGTIDDVVIGANSAASGQFTTLTAQNLQSTYGQLDLTSEGYSPSLPAIPIPGYSKGGASLRALLPNRPDVLIQVSSSGQFVVKDVDGTVMMQVVGTGRLLMHGIPDNGQDSIQTQTGIQTNKITVLSAPVGILDGTNKLYVDTQVNSAINAMTSLSNQVSMLGTMSAQNATNVDITGGQINGLSIGNNVPGTGQFTAVATPSIVNPTIGLSIDTSGTNGNAFNLTASDSLYPNVGINLLPMGSFKVGVGAVPILEVDGNQRILIGNPVDDGNSPVQIQGPLRLNSPPLLAAPYITDGQATATLGTNCPANASLTPSMWTQVTIIKNGILTTGYQPVWI